MPFNRVRRVGSFKRELVRKSREAALAAVQTFNNPAITFKSEIYIVLMIIAWTYLMHAYFRAQKVDYRYKQKKGNRTVYRKARSGNHKCWELSECLCHPKCPLSDDIKNNLRFLIGLRNEIEHQMTLGLDISVSAKFQACCINYNDTLVRLFGDGSAISKDFGVSLHFAGLERIQLEGLLGANSVPACASRYVKEFEAALTKDQIESHQYAYRTILIPRRVNHEGQADLAVQFVAADSPEAQQLDKLFVLNKVVKEKVDVEVPVLTVRPTYILKQIKAMMHEEGHTWFNQAFHTKLCRELDAKNPDNGFGGYTAQQYWYWYDTWIVVVRTHCESESKRRTAA